MAADSRKTSSTADSFLERMRSFQTVHTPADFDPDGARLRDFRNSYGKRSDYTPKRREPPTSTPTKPAPNPYDFQRQFEETSQQLLETRLELARAQRDCLVQQHELTEIRNRPTYDKLMPMKHSGQSNLDEYLTQFEAIASLQNWDDERKAIVLLSKLEGQALSVATIENQRAYNSM